MRTYGMVIVTLLLITFIGGCGGSSDSDKRISANTTIPFTLQEEADLQATVSVFSVNTGGRVQYNGSTAILEPNGDLTITDTTTTPHTFRRIQSEGTYWLVYDTTDYKISRFYFDATATAASSTYNSYLNPGGGLHRIGGAIQGGATAKWTGWDSLSSAPSSFRAALYAGSLTVTGSLNDITPTSATFNQPFDITADGTNYYVLDLNNRAIRQINTSTGVTTWTLTGDTRAFKEPEGITTDGTYVYVADTENNVIWQITIASTHTARIIAGNSNFGDGYGDSANGTSAGFNAPTGITTDGTNLYVVDSGNHAIRKVVISTGAVSTIAGRSRKSGDSDGYYTDARFHSPKRITTDGSNLYVTDTNNNMIRKIVIATGQVTTIAGRRNSMGPTDGSLGSNTFYYPVGITTDGANLYVTDTKPLSANSSAVTELYNNRIRKINLSSGDVSTIMGGLAGSLPSDYQDRAAPGDGPYVSGSPDNAYLATPRGILWDGSIAGLFVTNATYQVTVTSGKFQIGPSAYNCIFKVTATP